MQQPKKYCDAPNCHYNTPRMPHEVAQKIESVICPLCLTTLYCSPRCRDKDWISGHKSKCISSKGNNANRSQSLNDTFDVQSSAVSQRRKLDEFEIVNKKGKTELGKGSYGQVKLVRDKQNGMEFAMKIMLKQQIFEFCTVENLKREIKIQRKLQHPHITKLHHYFEDKEAVYLILEYAENGNLFSYLKQRKRLPESEAFVYFCQTCLGIDYLHKNNVLHRDLKPENLLLDKEGNIKLCDFGWSAETTGQGHKRMTFCGTCEYMAPEMIKNQPHDASLDIWSLGILLYELLHGHAPYRGKNDHDVCQNILEYRPIIFESNISKQAEALILGILRYKPGERLTMNQIFDDPWMTKIAKQYSMDIWSFVYQPSHAYQQQTAMSTFQPNSKQPSQAKQLTKDKPKLINPTTKTFPQDSQRMNHQVDRSRPYAEYGGNTDYRKKDRVSRVSTRNEIMQQTRENHIQSQQQDPGIGFMDRVFMAFGCIKRDQNPPKLR